jgi:hypothetical protein
MLPSLSLRVTLRLSAVIHADSARGSGGTWQRKSRAPAMLHCSCERAPSAANAVHESVGRQPAHFVWRGIRGPRRLGL